MYTFFRACHRTFAFSSRIKTLSEKIAPLIETGATVLDIGCGDGHIAAAIMAKRRDIHITGIDTLLRSTPAIEVTPYDGDRLPFDDRTFDYAILVDVLHHTTDPIRILRDAVRVARKGVLIKDHNCDTRFNRAVMSLTDWFANRPYGVAVPFNFLSEAEWTTAWSDLGITPTYYTTDIGLYSPVSRLYFAKNMDFIALCPTGEHHQG